MSRFFSDRDLVVVTQLAYLTFTDPDRAKSSTNLYEYFKDFDKSNPESSEQFKNFLYERKISADSEGIGQSRYHAAYDLFCELSDPNGRYADWKIIDIKSLNNLNVDNCDLWGLTPLTENLRI